LLTIASAQKCVDVVNCAPQRQSPDDAQAQQLRDEIMTLRNTLASETRFKMDLMHELGKARREVEHLQQQLTDRS
jgi:septal ring factor EnvC (AmiA/AmiB activator)